MSLEWNVMEAIITAWMHICNRQKVAKYVLERIDRRQQNMFQNEQTEGSKICFRTNKQKVAKYVLERIKTHKNAKENLKP